MQLIVYKVVYATFFYNIDRTYVGSDCGLKTLSQIHYSKTTHFSCIRFGNGFRETIWEMRLENRNQFHTIAIIPNVKSQTTFEALETGISSNHVIVWLRP